MIDQEAAYKEGEKLVIHIGEHVYITPPIPPKKEILFHDKKREKQYWVRQKDFPQFFYDYHSEKTRVGEGVELDAESTEYIDGMLVSLSVKDTEKLFGNKDKKIIGLQEREMMRCTEGVWFMNDGVPTYLTGNNYAILQWFPMVDCENLVEPGSNYGQYYRFQRDMAYYFDICKTTECAYGGLLIKPKKTGMTQFFSLICLNEGKTNRDKHVRMMSITEDLCKDSNFGFISYAIQKVPPILLPSRAKQNLGEVVFGPPGTGRNALRKTKDASTDYLNTRICTVPTTRTGFDTFTNYVALIDEFPKIKGNTYPKELFIATLNTVILGFKRKGTIFGLSYVPEETDRSFREAKKLYWDSKLRTRATNEEGESIGYTSSKLLCHTLVVQDGMINCCDKYGEPILEKIWAKIKEETDAIKIDDPDYKIRIQAIQRVYPKNEQDPWREGMMTDSLFDNIRLGEKRDILEERQSVGDLPYKEFNLRWDIPPVKEEYGDGYRFPGKVHIDWITDHDKMQGKFGKFKWYRPEWTPADFLQKHLNNNLKDPVTQKLKPNPNSPFFIGGDPTKYKISKKTGRQSMNSFQVFVLPNSKLNIQVGADVSNRRLMVHYYHRASHPAETIMDLIMLIILFGGYILLESNVTTWGTKLIEMGLGNFMLMMNEHGVLEPYEKWKFEDDKQGLFTAMKKTKDQYVHSAKEFLDSILAPGELDPIEQLDDITVIDQLIPFQKEDATEFDAAVAYLEAHMGMDAVLGWRRMKDANRYGDGTMRAMAKTMMR